MNERKPAVEEFTTIKARMDELRMIKERIRAAPEGEKPKLPGDGSYCGLCGACDNSEAAKLCHGACGF